MNQKLKKALRTAFDAPAPERKNTFLLSVNFPKATRLDFFLAQIGYIRKRVWVVALLAAAAMVIPYTRATENTLAFVWMVSSLLPFVVLAAITEIARSASYHMAELEISCKHSLSDVVLARLGIIGGADMAVFAAALASLRVLGHVEILRLGMYLFVPFLLTCALSLFALNRLRPREGVYLCGGISGFVSIANAFLSNQYSAVFSDENITFWGIAFFILLAWIAGEISKLIRRTGENQWNLSSTA